MDVVIIILILMSINDFCVIEFLIVVSGDVEADMETRKKLTESFGVTA